MRVNSMLGGSSVSALGATTVNTSTIGVRNNGGLNSYMNGSIYHVIAIKGTVPDADLLLLEKFVGQLSGVQI